MPITAGQRHQQQPDRHSKRNGYLTYQMTLRKVLRAQQLRINTRVHINWLHACDAGCGRLASSINSALSSSAAVQTWINGAINPSFQMYDFSTSIPAAALPATGALPLKSAFHASCPRWPGRRGELFAILIDPRFGNRWREVIFQTSKNTGGGKKRI